MIDINQERTFPLNVVRDRAPRKQHGRKLDLGTIYRWVTRGVKGERLEVLYVGGQIYTSMEALQRFFERVTARRLGKGTSEPMPSTPTARRRHTERVRRELDQAGL